MGVSSTPAIIKGYFSRASFTPAAPAPLMTIFKKLSVYQIIPQNSTECNLSANSCLLAFAKAEFRVIIKFHNGDFHFTFHSASFKAPNFHKNSTVRAQTTQKGASRSSLLKLLVFDFNQSSFSKASLSRPQVGQTKSSGRSSQAVPGAMPLSGSPLEGSYS